MSAEWPDLELAKPQLGQCDDGAFDEAVCQALNCLRDNVDNIFDILTLSGAGGDPTYSDSGNGGTDDVTVVMDEIPAGQHSQCANTVTVDTSVCYPDTSDNVGASGVDRRYAYQLRVVCIPHDGSGRSTLATASVSDSFNTAESQPGACIDESFTFSNLPCVGQITVELVTVSTSGIDSASFDAVATANCVD